MAEKLKDAIQEVKNTMTLLKTNWINLCKEYSAASRDEHPLSEFPYYVTKNVPVDTIISMLHAAYGPIVREADDYSELLEGNFEVPRWYFPLFFGGCSPSVLEGEVYEFYEEGGHDFDEFYKKVLSIRDKRIREERVLSKTEPISEELPLRFKKADFQRLGYTKVNVLNPALGGW